MSKNNIAVSVVLPSLNVKKYINECVSSVRAQTLKNIEIICVDAGSTDGTWEELQEIANIDARIALVHSDKKSYGYQVNLGMAMARGEYVAIVDTDDMIRSDMYEKLYEIAIREDADFVKADYEEFATQADQVIIKKIVPIVTDKSIYNRIVDIEKAQQCFHPQTTATWSGIYKRSFLEQNNIYHNETAGASYQDAGFYLQTYMFAKRAYFVNQPFYMYRVDNPNSSVVNPNKVYCICDEFDFIWNVVEKSEQLRVFNGILSWMFYKKYKRNIERIAEEFRGEFIERFAKDYNQLCKNGYLSEECFANEEWNELQQIREKATRYYEEIIRQKEQFLNSLSDVSHLIIYGAGKVGKEILFSLRQKENVVCFAVTECVEGGQLIAGKEVKCIDDLKLYTESVYVVIAVMHTEYREKMVEEARRVGFKNILTLPFGVFDY